MHAKPSFVLPCALLLAALTSPKALAHGPTPQKIDEQIEIKAPPAKVWALVRDFARFSAWNPRLKASAADKGNSVGSTRKLSLDSGGSITEELDECSESEMTLSYRSGREIDPAVLPVGSYTAKLKVVAAPGGSRIEWKARAYRADTGNEPPPGRDDAAAVEALTKLIRPALERAKRSLEGK